jgi:tripartite-type tricarboxylate transporter receptor subunit TctC
VLLAALCVPLPASAQSHLTSPGRAYPVKSIRMIVAFSTGASHVMAVLIAEKLRESLGQPVVPDFRPGAGGIVSAELAAKAPPDGYTLLLTSPSIVVSPALFPKLAYDAFRDFAPISLLATVPNVMVVHPSVPARTLQELVKLAKAHPGKLNYASGGFGSGRLGTELFKSLAKIDIRHVPYKGAALALAGQLSGEVELVTSTVPATIPYIQSGKLRGLVVMAPERVAAIRSVPTTAEAGMPELVALTWYGLFAPANVRQDLIERLNAEIVKLLRAPDVTSQLTKVGLDPAPNTPAEFAKFVRAEHDKWGRVIREANIRPE